MIWQDETDNPGEIGENPPEGGVGVEEPQSGMAGIASRIAKAIDSLDRVAAAFRTITPEEIEEVSRTFVSGDIEELPCCC